MENSSIPVSKDVVDFARLKELFENNDATIRELLNIFVTTTEPLLAELNTSISTGNFSQIKTLAHQIAGSAANLGIWKLHGLALQMENTASTNIATQCREVYQSMMVAFFDVDKVVKNFTLGYKPE
jgi:two-component system sensor histidine kinase/response regulator